MVASALTLAGSRPVAPMAPPRTSNFWFLSAKADATFGAVSLMRMGGASIAISIYGAIIGSQLAKVGVSIPGVADIEQLTPKMMAALPEASRQAVADAYSAAFTPLFMTSCAFALIGLIAAFLLKPVQLPRHGEAKTSAAAAEAAE